MPHNFITFARSNFPVLVVIDVDDGTCDCDVFVGVDSVAFVDCTVADVVVTLLMVGVVATVVVFFAFGFFAFFAVFCGAADVVDVVIAC